MRSIPSTPRCESFDDENEESLDICWGEDSLIDVLVYQNSHFVKDDTLNSIPTPITLPAVSGIYDPDFLFSSHEEQLDTSLKEYNGERAK